MRRFSSILVANRGEIAVRIIRTAKALGYRTVAVYSEADRCAPHVALADDAVLIGPGPATQSYLVIDRIVKAAATSGAQAIHPGYGFLSENAAFATACTEAGIVFIGPSAKSIELMGNKAAAKRRMQTAGVPCVPGYQGSDQSDATLSRAAADIGYPVMVKAAAGGGGRGMRLVKAATQLTAALAAARSEAQRSFGSDELILEKAIEQPRHVEIQVFADSHGTVLHLGERDCSVQRRHQKVLEEAPCPVMTPRLREDMGRAAVEAARSIDYRGAGTVEFLLDRFGKFFFLEMNTRLQVEHPVTEMVTGLDLVALQIAVADGAPLPLGQDDICLKGHAIEARLYAEDPSRKFFPCTGRIVRWSEPVGDGVRCDSGVTSGSDVSPFYDPMIAKIVAWGETRDTARRRLMKALSETSIFGLTTNRRFLIDMLGHETFAAGEATTAFIDEAFGGRHAATPDRVLVNSIGAVTLFLCRREGALARSLGVPRELLDWTSGELLPVRFDFDGERVTVTALGANLYAVDAGDDRRTVETLAFDTVGGQILCAIVGHRHRVPFFMASDGTLEIVVDGHRCILKDADGRTGLAKSAAGTGRVLAPMHGQIVRLHVAAHDKVAAGQRLAVLEAMKMQHDIVANFEGSVVVVNCSAGAQVTSGQILFEIAGLAAT